MKYKLLALDLDGTIRNRKNVISDRVKQAIIDIQKQGVKVAIASGRPVFGMRETARDLCLEQYGGYIMAHNGAIIVECNTDKVVRRELLPMGQITDYCRFAKENGCNMMTYDDSYLVTSDIEDEYIVHEAFVNGMELKATVDFSEYNDMPISKCMIAGHPDSILKMEKACQGMFGPKVDNYRSEPFYLEVIPKGVHKGSSLANLAEILGIKQEEVVACGDGYNDLTMIEYAGLGVAMANAQEAVKDVANYVTKSCDEDGVAYVVEKFMKS